MKWYKHLHPTHIRRGLSKYLHVFSEKIQRPFKFFKTECNNLLLRPPELKYLYQLCQKVFKNNLATSTYLSIRQAFKFDATTQCVYRNNCMLFRNNYKLPDCNLMLKIRTKILFFFSRIFMLRKGKGGKRAQQTRNHTNIHTPQQRHRNSAQKDQSCTFVLQEKMTINYCKQILWSFDVLTQWITFVNMWYVASVCSLTTQNHNVEFHEGKSKT